ncbi:MAG: AAA family ATPase [Spirulina sp. SIO3F2]|nr:AAA family ATPase [Spirulina sp. SIO3F2]
MEFTIALEQTEALALERQSYQLSEVDRLILQGTWAGQTYDEMAGNSPYSLNYLMRDVAPRLWKLLSKVYGERVSKSNYKVVCDRFHKGVSNSNATLLTPSTPTHAAPIEEPDWGGAPDVPDTGFFGRKAELKTCKAWLLDKKSPCRLLALWGLPGIGKTSLARRLANEVEKEFEFVIWRSLHSKPTLKALASDILPRLSNNIPQDEVIPQFMAVLSQSRCLVVLDGLESLLKDGDSWGRYERGYEDYGELLQRVAAVEHPSCVIVTSQEKPRELKLLEYPAQPVRLEELLGLNAEDAALDFGKAYGIKEHKVWQDLFERYDGHPAVLREIATLSRDLFGGQVSELLKMSMILPEDGFDQTDWHRLTEDERRFLGQIASDNSQSGVGLITAVSTFNQSKEKSLTRDALAMVENLKARSLIKVDTQNSSGKTHLNLSNLIKKFITRQPQQ